jgi:hypothetical protein
LIANSTADVPPASTQFSSTGGGHASQAGASEKSASFLTSLMEAAVAADAPSGKTPATPSASPRKGQKEKDAAGKSSDTSTPAGTVPVVTKAAPATLVRLLQFGLTIEPPSAESAAGKTVARAGSKSASGALSEPDEDFAANNSSSAEGAEPISPTSSANLAFALRLTDLAAPPATDAAATSQAAGDSHAEPVASRASAASVTNPVPPNAPVQTAPESGNQSGGQDASRNSRNSAPPHDDTALAEKTAPAVPVSTPASTPASTVMAAAAATSGSAIPEATAKETAPVVHTAPVSEPVERPVPAPAQHISLSLADSDNQRVEIHLMDRAGEVRVSVRSGDEALTHSMRADLTSLTGKLNQGGYGTESFAPAGASLSNSADRRQPSEGRESTGGNRQNPQQNQPGGQQQPPRDGRGQRPAWVEELENSLASGAANRSKEPWQRA